MLYSLVLAVTIASDITNVPQSSLEQTWKWTVPPPKMHGCPHEKGTISKRKKIVFQSHHFSRPELLVFRFMRVTKWWYMNAFYSIYTCTLYLFLCMYTRRYNTTYVYTYWMYHTMYLYTHTYTCIYNIYTRISKLYTGIFMRHSPKMTWHFSPLEVGNSMNVHSPWGHGTYNTSKFFPKSGSLEPEKLLCFLKKSVELLWWFAKESCLGKT